MASVNTVLGPIDSSDLGATLMHEHIFVISPDIEKTAGEWDEDARQADAVAKLKELKSRGVDTLVDLTVIGLGRYIPRIKSVASRVPDINIVVATGIYTYNDVPFFFHFRGPGTVMDGPELMTELFIRDIEAGIGETGVKAGILKCATDSHGVTEGVERVLRAVAQAHRATGVPISTHTPMPPEPWGLEQQRVFGEEGVDLEQVVIGHSCGTLDTNYHEELIGNGSYIGLDRFGVDNIPIEDRIDVVAKLCDRGHAGKIVLSHDAMCFVDWFPRELMEQATNWRWTHIPVDVLPAMRKRGISDEHIHQMMVENPKKVLERCEPY